MKNIARCLALCATLIAASPALAQESRQMNRIVTPQSAQRLPAGARAVAAIQPVSAATVEAAVRKLAAAWNTAELAKYLAPNFYGKDRLVESVNRQFPRDAKLRVLGIQGMQTVAQYTQDGMTVSRVLVTVRTQVEFNDPRGGLRRLEGTNEFALRVAEPGQ
jgi:hypothetical protein